jgi:wobble nucleotide-excising tRNase
MQQLLEILTRMEAKMNANQEKAKADRIADRECTKQMKAERKGDQEDLKRMMEEINAKMDANQAKAAIQDHLKRMMREMNAKMDGNQAEMRSTVCAMRSELKETIQHEMKAVIQPTLSELDENRLQNSSRD